MPGKNPCQTDSAAEAIDLLIIKVTAVNFTGGQKRKKMGVAV